MAEKRQDVIYGKKGFKIAIQKTVSARYCAKGAPFPVQNIAFSLFIQYIAER